MTNAISLVQRQLDAYNAQDLDVYVSCYAPNCVVATLNGAVTETGRDALRARYAKAFANFPENKARLVNRIAVGNTVASGMSCVCGPS